MAMTPISSLTAYADPDDLFERYDIRTIADLISVTGARVGGTVPNPVTVAADPRLLTMMADASGMIEAAVLHAGRVTPADLAVLQGNGLAFLKRLVCDLTIGMLYQNRPDKGAVPQQALNALKTLDDLKNGALIFGFQEQADAGLLSAKTETAADVYHRHGIVACAAHRYFGLRSDEMDYND